VAIERPAVTVEGRILGLYEHIRTQLEDVVRKGDRRAIPEFTLNLSPAQRKRLNDTSPLVTAAMAELEQMSRGEPVRYPCGYIGGSRFGDAARRIPWIADRCSGPRDMWVSADDTVRPAEPLSA
jgi:hypothetical protein